MSITSNFPTSKPALNLNFAGSKRLDPRVTFSRSSSGTYVDDDGLIKIAGTNRPRFDHDPVTGVCNGLLVEESRSNLVTNSNPWTGGTEVSWVSGQVSPTGGTEAYKMIESTANNIHGLIIGSGGYTNGYNQYLSVFAKSAGRRYLNFWAQLGTYPGVDSPECIFDLQTGTVASISTNLSAGIFSSPTIVNVGNGWYRCGVYINPTALTNRTMYLLMSNSGSQQASSYTGDGSSGILLFGLQQEAGSSPTSYIPTSGSAVTRAADTILLSGNNFSSFYNTSGGTITATVKPTSNTQNRTNILAIGDGSSTNYAALLSALPGAGGGQFRSTSSTIPQTDLTSVGSGQSVLNISASFTNNSFNINTNSNGISSGTTGTLATPNQLQIGVLGTSTNRFNGTISKINYYPSVVSNTNIIALSSANTIPSLRSNQFAFTVRIPSAGYTYTLLTNNSGSYNYNVDWGDGTVTNGITTNNPTRTYVNAGVYRVVVTQNSGSFYFYNNGNTTLGPVVTSGVSVGTGFSWSSNFRSAWQGCTSLTSFPLINTSNVTSFTSTWLFASLTSFPLIDTSNVTDFSSAWQQCFYLNSFPLLNTSNGTNFNSTWFACSSLTSFPQIDTSKGTNFKSTWYACSLLTSFPLINTSNGTDFSGTWQNCSSLTSFPLIDTSKGTNFANTWVNCTSLTSFPLINTSNGTNFNGTWYNCSSLTSFPTLNVSSGNDFTNAWRQTALTSFPAITFGGAGNTNPTFTSTWQSCTKLSSFPTGAFNACTGSTNYTNAWFNCGLGTTSIENILTSIVSSGATINTPTPGNIGLSGGTNASFSTWTSPAITAYNTLVGAGWTISYNP